MAFPLIAKAMELSIHAYKVTRTLPVLHGCIIALIVNNRLAHVFLMFSIAIFIYYNKEDNKYLYTKIYIEYSYIQTYCLGIPYRNPLYWSCAGIKE